MIALAHPMNYTVFNMKYINLDVLFNLLKRGMRMPSDDWMIYFR